METQTDPQTPHAAEGIRYLEAVPAQADAGRLEGLESLQKLRTAKGAMLAREQARLTAKYGADHPRVQALTQQITVNRLLVNHVAAEAGRAAVTEVDTDPKAWILHGRVMNRELQGRANVTVALYDSRGAWAQALGFACTNSAGYFQLSSPAASTAQPPAPRPGAQPAGGKANQPMSTTAPNSADSGGEPAGPVYIHVLDSKSVTLYTDPRALSPAGGVVEYVEIILGDTKPEECAPPDGKKPKAPKTKT